MGGEGVGGGVLTFQKHLSCTIYLSSSLLSLSLSLRLPLSLSSSLSLSQSLSVTVCLQKKAQALKTFD